MPDEEPTSVAPRPARLNAEALKHVLRPPADLAAGEARLFSLRLVACFLAVGCHLIQTAIFWAVGLNALAWVSLGAILWLVGCAHLVRTGRGQTGTLAMWLELALISLLLTTAFGVRAGYMLYWFLLSCGVFLLLPEQQRAWSWWLAGLTSVGAVAVLVLGPPFGPWRPVGPELTRVFFGLSAAGTLVGLLACTSYFARVSARAEAEAQRERKRSDDLLRNVLPEAIAARLKDAPGVLADHFDSVTVLFADVVGFTALTATMSTQALIEMLNTLFSRFDRLAERHRLEKIKTIGDAYMVVGGLPESRPNHAQAVARFALALREEVHRYASEGGHQVDVRIGIHTGPVVAGVIGVHKFAYDLWGDTVNTASRMESHGVAGRIHVSEAVRDVLEPEFLLTDRGVIEVKSKGAMHTWFLEREA